MRRVRVYLTLSFYYISAMNLQQITDAIKNNVSNGLKGVANYSLSDEQLSDEILNFRSKIIEAQSKLPYHDKWAHAQSINCLELDCENLSRCCNIDTNDQTTHFEIPRLVTTTGWDNIMYLGTADRQQNYKVYTNPNHIQYAKYRFSTGDKPYAWIDMIVNSDNNHDGFLFNAPPALELISITAIFQDPYVLRERYECCQGEPYEIHKKIADDIIAHLTERYLRYYTRLQVQQPNTQTGVAQ